MSAIPKKIRLAVIERAWYRCEAVWSDKEGRQVRCSQKGVDLHHLLSRAQGGQHTTDNLILFCRPCHQKVTDCKPGTEKYRLHKQKRK